MSPETPSVRELTRRLVAHEAAQDDASDRTAAAAHAACERAYRTLARWLGENGCRALFTRALAQARAAHPALGALVLRTEPGPVLGGVGESVEAHGEAVVTVGLEALLAALIELLGRLIGADMTARLLLPGADRSMPTTRETSASDDESLERRSATP